MAKVNIKSLAVAAEIVASIAVVISLLLVVSSIDQNTKSLQSINDNFLYELQSQRLRDVTNDGELASILDKAFAGKDLTNSEKRRYRYWQQQNVNSWELAFNRYKDELLPEAQWNAWDRYWSADIPASVTEEQWSAIRYQYGDDFAAHVDAAYARH